MLFRGLASFLNAIIRGLGVVGGAILSVLPNSPFSGLGNIEIPFLGYINYVIPINFIVTVLAVWLPAVALYYGVSIILRWIKAIE